MPAYCHFGVIRELEAIVESLVEERHRHTVCSWAIYLKSCLKSTCLITLFNSLVVHFVNLRQSDHAIVQLLTMHYVITSQQEIRNLYDRISVMRAAETELQRKFDCEKHEIFQFYANQYVLSTPYN